MNCCLVRLCEQAIVCADHIFYRLVFGSAGTFLNVCRISLFKINT